MLQVCATRYPDNYKLPIWVLWGLAGLMLVCIVVVPETPWFYARRGDKTNGMKVLHRLYSNIKGYNFEEEWGIMIRKAARVDANLKSRHARQHHFHFLSSLFILCGDR